MKVKMLVSMAGPDESWKPGDTREVAEATALEWEISGIAAVLPEEDIIIFDDAAESTPATKPVKTASKTKKSK